MLFSVWTHFLFCLHFWRVSSLGIELQVVIYFLSSSHCLLTPLFLLEKQYVWFSSAFNNASKCFSLYLRCLSYIHPLESVAWCLLLGLEYFFWYCFCSTLYSLPFGILDTCMLDLSLHASLISYAFFCIFHSFSCSYLDNICWTIF